MPDSYNEVIHDGLRKKICAQMPEKFWLTEITLPDLIKTASYLLKHSGKFYMIYHPFRLAELISLLRKARLEPKRIRFVHSKAGEEAKMALVESVKGSGTWLKIDPPLYLYGKTGNYSMEIKKILRK